MWTVIPFLCFLSGITGLLYEVLWAKYLSLVLGNTADAHTLVLAGFLGGLALGNGVLGPWVDRADNQLRLYGWLELGIGLLGVTSPFLFSLLTDGFAALARSGVLSPILSFVLKFTLCLGVLLPPTILMGGTLPALSRLATPALNQMEATLSWLYFLNNAGAALGAILAGFLLIPIYGLDLSTTFAAILNVGVAVIALALADKITRGKPTPRMKVDLRAINLPANRLQVRLLYAAVLLSGFVSLAYEIAWIRLLALVLGSSTYTFSLMLAAFIAGLALGSLLISCRVVPSLHSYALFGLAEMGIALAMLFTLPIYGRLPYYFLLLGGLLNRTPLTFYLHESGKFLFCFALMLLPTICLGMTLPLASRVVTMAVAQVGEKVGRVWSVNTIGNVLGAAAAGLFLLPLLGIKTLIECGIVVNLLVGCSVLWTSFQWGTRRKATVATGGLLALLIYILFGPSWDMLILSSGEFRNRQPAQLLSYREYKEGFKQSSLLFYKDDRDATVTVVQGRNGDISLKVNGKIDASAQGDLATQLLLAHVPFLFAAEARQALVIGLGSGITAGAALRYPVERLDLVEISAGVVEAAQFFHPHNARALDDPRLRLHLEDAKTFLAWTPQGYDVIISEPSNPWIAGIGNLFSVEFYREARAHLKAGGLMAQWFHSYEMDDDNVRLILRTFSSVFEHVTLWNLSHTDFLLLGATSPLSLDFRRVEKNFAQPDVREDLRRIGIEMLATPLSLQVVSDAGVRAMAGQGRLNEDRFPILEYQAPRTFFLGLVSTLVEGHDERDMPAHRSALYLTKYLQGRDQPLSSDELKDLVRYHHAYGGKRASRVFLSEWTRRYPRDPEALWALVRAEQAEGKIDSALSNVELLLREDPTKREYLETAADLEIARYLGNRSYLNEFGPQKGLAYLHRLLESGGESQAQVYRKIAYVYVAERDYQTALSYLEQAAERATQEGKEAFPADHLWIEAAEIALRMPELQKAQDYARKALASNSTSHAAKRILQQLSPLR